MIRELSLVRLALPLKVPYKLAFGAIERFDTILATARLDSGEGTGEATVLSGYTDETIEGSWARAKAFAVRLPGLSPEAAKVLAAAELKDAPFTQTAFISAIEMAEGHPLLAIDAPVAVPLLVGIEATDEAGIASEIESALAAGARTLKIKVGFDADKDLDRVRLIQRLNAGRARLRIDANQGYDRAAALRFARALSPAGIELLEQPCAAADWDSAAEVAKASAVPLMLDESIYGVADIERAAKIGAAFVKLKLMKLGGLTRLASALERIGELGMRAVLGNGVASDIGCWQEACVARRHVTTAGEMNGFLRQKQALAANPMRVAGGAIRLAPGTLHLDPVRVRAFTLERREFGAESRVRKASVS
jgi:L-alanine-DL-glutamate epimerase-like enolase superfamily enzyme